MLFKNHPGKVFPVISLHRLLFKIFVLLSLSALSFIGPGFPFFPAASVVTELRCNEGAGTTTADASGNGHTATLTNGPTWGTGKYGQGINLDGSNDYISIPDHTDYTLTPTVSYTWSAWVKNNNFNQWSTVWSQTLSSSSFFYFYAHSSTDNEAGPVTNGISVYWYSGSSKLVVHSNNNVLSTGTWSYVAVTYDASQSQVNRFTIYINGTDVTNRSDIVSSGTLGSIDPISIRVGSNQPFGEYLNGAVDEVRYYRRLLSVSEIQADMNIGNGADVTPPTISITSPNGGTVSGTINVNANAADNVGISGVQFLLDGSALGAEDISSPYSVPWNTITISNGNHTLTARARDAAGNTSTSSQIIVNVNNPDVAAPAVSITSPAPGNVSGTVNINATASDNIGVVGVQFLLDGNNLGSEDLTSPYSVSWNTTTLSNGSHTLTAKARDAVGNSTTSVGVIVTINNDVAAPTINITSPASGPVTGTINVTANASDNVGVAGVQFLLDGNNLGSEDVSSPYSISWNTTSTTNGSHNLSARARDAAGNTTMSVLVVVDVNNDLQAPTVTVDQPATSPLGGTVNVTATASDNIGIAGVQFLLDGNALGSEDVAAPYSISWNTISTTNGNHSLTARARDAAGNSTTSAVVTFNVFNNKLVAAYGFNENTGTTTNDNSGNGNTGTLTNGPGWSSSGKYGAAILFDGVDDFVNINDANSLDLTNAMTLEAWVNASDLTGYKTAICKENGSTSFAYALSPNNNNSNGSSSQRPNARMRIGTSTTTVTGASKLSLNAWTHVAATYDGSVLRLYIDGTVSSSTSISGSIASTSNPLRIGGSSALAQYFTGLIDEVRIYARALSQSEIQTDMNTPIAPDVTNPTISITAPSAGDVSGIINVSANASDNIGVVGVQFLLNGVNLDAEVTTSPYTLPWNTTTVADGNYTLTAKARDAAGNTTTSSPVVVNVLNHPPDTQGPTVNLTNPAAGEVLGTVNITASANDNVGVVGVQFLLNGNNFGAEVLSAPYSVSWNTLAVANGSYTITAKARDAAGNVTTSAAVVVTVNNAADNQPPVVDVVAPPPGPVSGTVTINVNASDNIGVAGVQFLLDGTPFDPQDSIAPYSFSWNTRTVNNGNHTLTATARDAAGNVGTSGPVVVDVTNDLTPPAITITAPGGGTVSGTINITGNASDNVGVVGVQFLLDGINFGAEDLSSPYSVSWNTSTSANGNHVLTAKARDAEGNITTSSPITVNVNNVTNLLTAINFNEGTGTTAADLSGNNHNGTLTSNPTWVAGKYGQAVNFNGSGNYVNIADHNDYSLDPAQNYTWSAWIKNTDFHEWSTVWSQTVSTSTFFYFYAHTTTDPDGGPVTNGISVYWWNNGGSAKLGVHTSNNVLTAGQWSHVAITYNASQPQNNRITIYVNGVDVTLRTDVASVGTIASINPTNIRIGSNQPFGEYLNGAVDEVRYYNRLLSQGEIQADMNTPIGVDNTAPVINVSGPANNTSVAGTINVTANASDNVGIAGVQFLLDGNNLGAEDVSSPYSVSWNSTTATNGTHTLTAKARDAAGNNTTSAAVTITVDNSAPSVSITLPAAGNVNGNVDINANASDNNGIVGVQFLLNGVNLGSEDLTAPYSFTWNTNSVSDGNYTVTAKARDAAGNSTTSSAVAVNVLNHPPDNEAPTVNITAPAAGEVVGMVNVTADATDSTGVVGVQFLLNGNNLGAEKTNPPYSYSWNTYSVANGTYTLTARARDAAGHVTISADVVVNVNNPPDTELPVVNITAPAAGNVMGTINVSANASDNSGVVGVKFLLNGSLIGSEDLTAPYSITWNTQTVSNGSYTLTAVARDAAGNTGSSTDVIVTVSNDVTPPTVNISSPTGGNVSGTVTVTANASDNVGIAGVQFLLDGNNLGAEVTNAPYSISWNTFLASNGNHTLSAKARDTSGNVNSAPNVIITVANTTPIISAITITTITESSAIINWTTNIPATSQVNYGPAASYGLYTLVDSALVTSHSQILNSLPPGTLHHFQVLSGNPGGNPTASGDNTFTTASLAATLGTMNTHTVFAYPANKIVPWTPNPTACYDTIMDLLWNYLLNQVPNDPSTGKPAYYSRSYINPDNQQMVDWPHNPAGLYGMMIEAAIKYYGYSGNASVMQIANDIALWHLDHGMTLATDSWAKVPYSEGQSGSTTYGGAPSDGVGVLEPDKIGEFGYSLLQLYKYNGNTRFRDAAIQWADVLAAKIRVGNTTQSPWPFRVNAQNGSVVENYCSNVTGPISLFDGLIAAGLGNTAAYQTARTSAWNWIMTFPMVNNVWSQYFEDVGVEGSYNSNLNQYNAMMVARYLLEHPEMDTGWKNHARGLITWVENTFLQPWFGANTIREQQEFFLAMGSHTSRYASVNALLYEKTGDLVAKEKAYRSFNWSSYMCRSNGVSIDGPDINNEWFTDAYAELIRHFMTGVGAVPEWTPAYQTHLVRSTSVVKNIFYGSNTLNYTTFDGTSTEIIHISYNPVTITANGVALPHRTDLSQPGWTLDIATKTLKVYHTGATQIVINPAGQGSRLITQTATPVDTVAEKSAVQNVVAIKKEGNAITSLRIVPNPASGDFVVAYNANAKGNALITVTGMDGRQYYSISKSVVMGGNVFRISANGRMKPGVYIVSIEQGSIRHQEKLVFQ